MLIFFINVFDRKMNVFYLKLTEIKNFTTMLNFTKHTYIYIYIYFTVVRRQPKAGKGNTFVG